ncbi:MAG: D-alanine--D-alanine ligase, partial [Saprospiraceae bacterium]
MQRKVNHNRYSNIRIWWHKLTNWEYWSVNIIYLPTFFLWIWHMIKFRSFKFYKYSNPSIINGGFYGDSKIKIYDLLPKYMYPKTVLVDKDRPAKMEELIFQSQFQFPLIAKPDIGCRGIGVQKIDNIKQLIEYDMNIATNYLIQELVDFPNEIGLFYCRLPDQENGKITGITLKKFLTVQGNGKDSI